MSRTGRAIEFIEQWKADTTSDIDAWDAITILDGIDPLGRQAENARLREALERIAEPAHAPGVASGWQVLVRAYESIAREALEGE